MEIFINNEWIEVDPVEYKQWLIDKANNYE